jgi:capsid protein
MRKKQEYNLNFLQKTGRVVDRFVATVNPEAGLKRMFTRRAYDALGKGPHNKQKKKIKGTDDVILDELTLSEGRDESRDECRNNPIAKGLLKTERNGVIGSALPIQAKTSDKKWNKDAEASWKAEMLDKPCDITGRFNFIQYLRKYYYSYRRDGDILTIYHTDDLEAMEGEQLGTPLGNKKDHKHFEVVNGIAFSKKTRRVIGYYMGKPHAKYGYIKRDSFQKYKADIVHHMFNPDRFSHSRGEPALMTCLDELQKLVKYLDAEQVAAIINACFCMFISSENEYGIPDTYTGGSSSDGRDSDTQTRYEKMTPGQIMYGNSNEKPYGIGQARPGTSFDPYILRMLSIIGRPLCMPLMLVSLDFSGATFMNARLAYDEVRENWRGEQIETVVPFASRTWQWHINRMIRKKVLTDIPDKYAHEVFCRKWPYIDPWKEAKAEEQFLRNRTECRTDMAAARGKDIIEVEAKRKIEDERIIESGGDTEPWNKNKKETKDEK